MPKALTSSDDLPRRRWRRLSAHVALAAVAGTLTAVVLPGAAHAAVIPCPTDPNIVWIGPQAVAKNIVVYKGVRYDVVSSTPTFYVSDARVVDNSLDTPITATFTSAQSRTYTVTVTVGTSTQLVKKLQTNVSVSIVESRSTSIGVNATATVAAHSRVIGNYGVEGFDIVYDAQSVWKRADSTGICIDQGTQRASTSAPTYVEGWRISAA